MASFRKVTTSTRSTSSSPTGVKAPRARRMVADGLFGLVLFAALALGLLGVPGTSDILSGGEARAADLARVAAFTGPTLDAGAGIAGAKPAILVSSRSPEMTVTPANRTAAAALLAAVFTIFVAFNLALFRHVRRVYVAPPARRRRDPRTFEG